MKINNFPFKYIDENNVEHTLWYSRSVAVELYVFAKDNKGKWNVLACQRGPGCPNEVGKYCVPCGYLDFDERTRQAAVRECLEETGIRVLEDNVHFWGVISIPDYYNSNNVDNHNPYSQNVVHRYAVVLNDTVENITRDFSFNNNEQDECTDIRFICIDDTYKFNWAFYHKRTIHSIYKTYIQDWYEYEMNIWNRIKNAWDYIFHYDRCWYKYEYRPHQHHIL